MLWFLQGKMETIVRQKPAEIYYIMMKIVLFDKIRAVEKRSCHTVDAAWEMV